MEEVRSDKLVQCVVYLCLRHGNGRRPRVGPTRETARLRHSLRRICVASGGKTRACRIDSWGGGERWNGGRCAPMQRLNRSGASVGYT